MLEKRMHLTSGVDGGVFWNHLGSHPALCCLRFLRSQTLFPCVVRVRSGVVLLPEGRGICWEPHS